MLRVILDTIRMAALFFALTTLGLGLIIGMWGVAFVYFVYGFGFYCAATILKNSMLENCHEEITGGDHSGQGKGTFGNHGAVDSGGTGGGAACDKGPHAEVMKLAPKPRASARLRPRGLPQRPSKSQYWSPATPPAGRSRRA